MFVIAPDAAKAEVTAWMEFMEAETKHEPGSAAQLFIESFVDSVAKGYLVIKEDKSIVQKLRVPLANGEGLKEITYSFRFTVGAYHDAMKGVDPTDEFAYVLAKLQLISKQAPAVLRNLDNKDYKVAKALAVFF